MRLLNVEIFKRHPSLSIGGIARNRDNWILRNWLWKTIERNMLPRILFALLWHCLTASHANEAPPQKILSIEANCTRDLMHIKINMGRPFRGMVFAKGFSDECGSVAGKTRRIEIPQTSFQAFHFQSGSPSLTLPLSSCGVRSRVISRDTMQYSVRLVAQMDSKLQQKSDLEAFAKCSVPTEMMDVNLHDYEPKPMRNGRMRFLKAATKIRSWLEVGSREGQDFAIVGENATLSVRSILARKVGMRVVDCVAFDGVGESSQRLFDEFGCPIDTQIMPDFTETIVDIENGWSKNHDDDVVQKVFTTHFHAFKFPDRDIIHINCGIHLCKGQCPHETCDGIVRAKLQKPLARVEVFNSLKMLAPQIEIDRPMERNESSGKQVLGCVTENVLISLIYLAYPSAQSAYLGPDVLCVSQSKLAIAFCTLGVIFLVAVVIAIFCSLRYLSQRKIYRRSQPPSDHSGRRSIFSVSSGTNPSQSSLDIDSKLFAYGRVY